MYGSGIEGIGASAFQGDCKLSYIDARRATQLEEALPAGTKFEGTRLATLFYLQGLAQDVTLYVRSGTQANAIKGGLSAYSAFNNGKVQKYVVLGDESAVPSYTETLASHEGQFF